MPGYLPELFDGKKEYGSAEYSSKDNFLMFTGLVQYLGSINSIAHEPPGVRLAVHAGPLAQGIRIGDSICTNGCCLSVVQTDGETLEFQLGPETIQRTNFGTCKAADSINLERSLTLQDRLDGHLVTGHIDGLGILEDRIQEKDWVTCRFTCPKNLLAQLAAKGSVAVDGVSLTVVDVNETSFSVALIPHTLSHTTLGELAVGDEVNLETDLISKYVCRWLEARS